MVINQFLNCHPLAVLLAWLKMTMTKINDGCWQERHLLNAVREGQRHCLLQNSWLAVDWQGAGSLTDICSSILVRGKEESRPEPAWGQVKATLDKCLPIAHNSPQNQFETPSMVPWYIRVIWRNQFKVSLWRSDEWHPSWHGGWKRWNTHVVCLTYLPRTDLPFMTGKTPQLSKGEDVTCQRDAGQITSAYPNTSGPLSVI